MRVRDIPNRYKNCIQQRRQELTYFPINEPGAVVYIFTSHRVAGGSTVQDVSLHSGNSRTVLSDLSCNCL